jgi:hypothetical protein
MFLQIFVGAIISLMVYEPPPEAHGDFIFSGDSEPPRSLLQCFTENQFFTVPLISFIALFILQKLIKLKIKQQEGEQL